ncbi:MAG: hypothetical protein AAGF77_07875, partial [Bacteroidota bacterium]
ADGSSETITNLSSPLFLFKISTKNILKQSKGTIPIVWYKKEIPALALVCNSPCYCPSVTV